MIFLRYDIGMTLSVSSYFMSYIMGLTLIPGFIRGTSWWLLTPLFMFGVVPILDAVIGRKRKNISKEMAIIAKKQGQYLFPLYLWIPVQITILFYSLNQIGGSLLELFILALSVGLVTGAIGITIAHELIHKSDLLSRFLGNLLLVTVNYGYYSIEHIYGHHVRVSTPQDPASARFNETIYRFLPRTLMGTINSAYRLNSKKCLCFMVIQFFLMVLIGFYYGLLGILFYILQGLIAVVLLECVNYVEHYGLSRKKLSNGNYERVRVVHSWNSDFLFTNLLLFNLQRHSDHHAYASRPYQILRTYEQAPELPFSYPTMILLSFYPPVFKKLTHPLIPK